MVINVTYRRLLYGNVNYGINNGIFLTQKKVFLKHYHFYGIHTIENRPKNTHYHFYTIARVNAKTRSLPCIFITIEDIFHLVPSRFRIKMVYDMRLKKSKLWYCFFTPIYTIITINIF